MPIPRAGDEGGEIPVIQRFGGLTGFFRNDIMRATKKIEGELHVRSFKVGQHQA